MGWKTHHRDRQKPTYRKDPCCEYCIWLNQNSESNAHEDKPANYCRVKCENVKKDFICRGYIEDLNG